MKREINPDKLKALDKALAGLDKQFGKGTAMKLGDAPKVNIEVIPSGSLLLNKALGVGGYPRGRIIEIYGPESSGKTTLTLHAIAEAQKAGGLCAFVDAEHALDPTYAEALGVDIDNLVVSQPDTGEQGLDVVEALVKSGALDLIIVDSVAALVPKAEIEGEMGQSFIGIHARLMSQALRKLAGIVHKTNTTVIFINQIREKVGVMFGCLHADTLVNFSDGRALPIREVVENQIEGKVWSFNEDTKQFEEKQIIDWHYNGDVESREDYIHIQTEGIEHNGGIFGITVTPDHEVMTEKGWKKAKDVSFDDKLLSKYTSKVNGTLKDFLYGTFVGDCHIKTRHKNTASINFQDKNTDYLEWKINKLSKFIGFNRVKENRFESEYNFELSKVKRNLGRRDPLEFFKNYSDLGLALWYMDDGTFDNTNSHYRASISIKRFKDDRDKLNSIVEKFSELGMEVKYDNFGTIRFDKENTAKLFERIHKFVPEFMQYKIGEEFKGKYEEFDLSFETKLEEEFVNITEIRKSSKRQFKQRGKYDITVEDNHNYLVGGNTNGVIVHNSPEVTTGGRALKFYASVRLDIRRKEAIKKGDEILGNRTKVKVVKNKVAPPFREVEFEIMYGKGIDTAGELVDAAVADDIIKKAGAWFSYGEMRWQGKENTKEGIAGDPALFNELMNKVNGEKLVEEGEEVEDKEQDIEPFDI